MGEAYVLGCIAIWLDKIQGVLKVLKAYSHKIKVVCIAHGIIHKKHNYLIKAFNGQHIALTLQ